MSTHLTPAEVDDLRFAVRADRLATSQSARLESAVEKIKAEAGRAALQKLADDIDPNGYGWTSIRDARRFAQKIRERADRGGTQ